MGAFRRRRRMDEIGRYGERRFQFRQSPRLSGKSVPMGATGTTGSNLSGESVLGTGISVLSAGRVDESGTANGTPKRTGRIYSDNYGGTKYPAVRFGELKT